MIKFFTSVSIVMKLPTLSPQTFWDINISALSFEDSKDWIIERVFDRGSWMK